MAIENNSIQESSLDLPTDFPRPTDSKYRGIHHLGVLDSAIWERLKDFSEPEACLLASYVALLSRYSGQMEIRIGREYPNEKETSAGRLVEIVASFIGGMGLREMTKGLTVQIETALREEGEKAFSSVVFSDGPHFPSGPHSECWIDPHRADLNLAFAERGERMEYRLSANGLLFEPETLERMMGHFQTLLSAALLDPDRPLEELPLLTESERERILVDWNDTKTDYPRGLCVHQLFEKQAESAPEAVAVVFENDSITYRELNERANRLAHRLIGLGVGPDTMVGVYVGRTFDLMIAILGTLKAGGAYVPLDPEFPAERLAFMIEDTGLPVILTQEPLFDSLPEHNAKVLKIDSEWDSIAEEEASNPNSGVTPDNLAYTIYTSGSTGKPKGVLVEHGNAVNFFTGMDDRVRHDPPGVWLAVTSLSFDISVLELFWTLARGFKIVLYSEKSSERDFSVADSIERHGVTHLQCTPSMAGILAGDRNSRKALGSLKQMMVGGEAFPLALATDLRGLLSGELTNMYGPTETTIWSTTFSIESVGSQIPIGRPIANTDIYILDAHGQPVPVGVPGELYIGGAGVVRGYHNHPELTAERFVENPFAPTVGARMYRTGDLVRYRKDGDIDFLGRLDHQVKISGHRIELGEIEAVLESYSAIEKAIVVAREDLPGDKRLVAYLTPSKQEVPGESELRAHLGEKIPDYMIPSAFVGLREFPLTPNGKVDRKALPAPQRRRPHLEGAYTAPKNALEKRLAELWSANLLIDDVGTQDPFFKLGGASIQAARFINSLQEELGETIYVVSLFEAPTISEYAAFLQKNYPEAIANKYPEMASSRLSVGEGTRRLEARDWEVIREHIPALPPGREAVDYAEPKNAGVIFILAPPRSGTTLLRVMLAGHPNLFCPAELQLLGFNTLVERKEAFTGKFSLWAEGAIRALMDQENCDAEEAKAIMERHETEGLTTKQFYKVLQEKCGDRILVDKSPSYSSDLRTLRKAELDFENARYIHLARHPYSMVRSFEDYRMNQVLFIREHPYSARQLGELLWSVSHENILEFLKDVPANRRFRMRYEDLVQDPERIMREMCDELDLDFRQGLLKPYEETEKKMTDGIYAESTPMGDKKFLKHQKIDPKVAESWKKVAEDNFLAPKTWEIAENLGYLQTEALPAKPASPVEAELRDARAQRRSGREGRRTRRLKLRNT